MKRFMLFIAMVGFVATSCSKTIVKDEVGTTISFSTESAKLTRAIVQDDDYFDADAQPFGAQPFGVFAYSHQKDAAGNVKTTTVMNNVEVYNDKTDANNPVWRASGDVKYYWPNDPLTSMDFYAFSPACSDANVTQGLDAHQQLNGEVEHSEDEGFSLTDYVHSNMYVDFMLATPVKGATYVNPDGSVANDGTPIVDDDTDGKVPMEFNHKMTQIVFDVTTDNVYSGVKFTVEEITLKNIVSKGTYTCEADGTQAWAYANQPPKTNYTIFPANTTNGALITNAKENNVEKPLVIDYITSTPASPAKVTTTGVTMIPQNMTQTEIPYVAGSDALANERDAQVFMIKYSISGTGVATETVTKHIPFYPSEADINKQGQGYVYNVIDWDINKRVTYKVMIGLNEVTFEPSVADWSNEGGNEYTFKQ